MDRPGYGVTTTSTFADLGDSRTEIRIRQMNVPEAFRSAEAQAGFSTSLDRFAAYLGTLSSITGSNKEPKKIADEKEGSL